MPQNNPMAYFIDPKLRQQQAQGVGAQAQIKAIPQSAEYALALRDATTPLVGQMGSPTEWGYSGPTFMNLLSNAVTQHQGRQKLGALDTQIKALRGNAEKGRLAESEIEELIRQQGMNFKREMADKALEQSAGGLETFTDPDGNKFTVQRNRGGNVQVVPELEGATPYSPPRQLSGRGSATEIKQVVPSLAVINQTQHARGLAEQLSVDDEQTLNQLAKRAAQKAFTPAELEQYIEQNYAGYSSEVKRYLEAMRRISAKARHTLSGSALTRMEKRITDAFLPSADGITLEDRMARLGGLYDEALINLQSVDQVLGTEHAKPYSKWEEWTTPMAKRDGLVPQSMEGMTPDRVAKFDRYRQLKGEYHPNDPRRNKVADEKFRNDIGSAIENLF